MIRTDFQDEYFLWYEEPDQGSFFTEPRIVSLYFPKSDQAFACWFRPDNPKTKPPVRLQLLYGLNYLDGFYVWENEVFLTDCCYRGVTHTIRKIVGSPQFDLCFKPVASPSPRWSNLCWVERELPSAALEFRDALARRYVNGNVELLYLAAADSNEFADCMRFYPWPQSYFPLQAFRNPIFAQCDWITGGGSDLEKLTKAEWHQESSPFHMAATFASKLFYGGAYGSHSNPKEAVQTAESAKAALWGENYSSLLAWSSSTPWSSWFSDVAWDWTFVALDWHHQTLTCLIATDTD
jgi:hypothetical protein